MTDTPPDTPSTPLDTISGDRACASCGFNLFGQPITRESHYGLIIARCPECGSVAALQEYPALGKWTRRWTGALAGLWLVLLVAIFAGMTMTSFGLTVGSIEVLADDASIAEHGDAFLALLRANQSDAAKLEDLLLTSTSTAGDLDEQFERMKTSCRACHERYRN